MSAMARPWSLRRKIIFGYGALLIVALAIFAGYRLSFHKVIEGATQTAARSGRNVTWAQQLESLAARAEASGQAFALSQDDAELESVRQSWQQFELVFEALWDTAADPRSHQLLSTVRAARDRERRALEDMVRSVRGGRAVAKSDRDALLSARDQLAIALEDLSSHQRGQLASARQSTARSAQERDEALSALSLVGVALAAAGAFLYARAVAAAVERDQAQERFRVLVNGVPDYGIALLDAEGRVESWNPAAEQIFGYSADEVLGAPFERFFTHDGAGKARADRSLEAAVRHGRFEDHGWRVRKDESAFWANSVVAPVRDRTGRVRGYSFICRDTTAARRAEQERAELLERERRARHELQGALRALQKSERRERSLYEANLIGVFFFDFDGRVLEANDAFLSLIDQDRGALDGRGLMFERLLSPGAVKVSRDTLRGVREEGVFAPVETELVARSGRRVPVLLGAASVEDSHEGVAFVLDTTERKRAEDALRFLTEATALLSSSLDYATTLARVARLAVPALADWCMVELEDQEGVLRRMAVVHRDEEKDELAQQLLGPLPGARPRPPVLGSGEPELVEDVGALMEEIAATAGERSVVEQLGFSAAMVVPLYVRNRPMGAMLLVSADPARKYRAADLEVAMELAQRCAAAVDNARLYQEAQEAIRARDEFLSIASHELKTPLTSLTLLVHALQKHVLPQSADEGVRMRLGSIERQARRLARLTDELLDISRIRLGRLELDLQDVDLGELVRETIARFREESIARGSELRLSVEGSAIGRWDRSRIEQVVSNLISNALKYGEGKPIEVRVRPEGGLATLTVSDRGIGIPENQQARIFQRFERAVSSRNYSGLGLGLYIVRQIVNAHGGDIRVQSQPGAGSTFSVELPLRPIARVETAAGAPLH
jgi:PAS domain S-box-containing protein